MGGLRQQWREFERRRLSRISVDIIPSTHLELAVTTTQESDKELPPVSVDSEHDAHQTIVFDEF